MLAIKNGLSMIRKAIWIFLWAATILFSKTVNAQQDVQFSQYIFTGLALNPAYAGYKEETIIHILYRDQWTGLTGAPKTISVLMDGIAQDERIGLGGKVIQDELGAQTSLTAMGVFAYRVPLNDESKLAFGLGVGVDQYGLNPSKLMTETLNDPAYGNLQTNLIQPDFQFGLFFSTPTYYAAFSATDLFANFQGSNPAYLVIYRNRHYYLQGGGLFNISSDLKLKPSVILKEDFLGPTNLDLNLFLLLSDRIWVGGSYRRAVNIFPKHKLQTNLIQNDAYSILAEFFVTDRLRIGYSFDYTTNLLKDVNNGTHEISIGYTFRSHRAPILSPRYF